MLLKVGGAGHAQWATVQNMCVDHCGADVFVAHQLLNRADVLVAFQEVGGGCGYILSGTLAVQFQGCH